jgi:hypothetical protein
MERTMNDAKKRQTPYDIDWNICGVNRAIMKANDLGKDINTIVRSGNRAAHQFDAETNACEGGHVAGNFCRRQAMAYLGHN